MDLTQPALAPIRLLTTIVFGHDAFISYARRDATTYATALWQQLEAKGFTVFRDEESFADGQALRRGLERAIRRSRYVILIDSPSARRSPHVKSEIDAALRCGLDVVRVCFPITDSDRVWHQLAAHAQEFRQRTWVDEQTADPWTDPPSNAVIRALVKTLRIWRVRSRFRLVATLSVVLVTSWWAVRSAIDSATDRANAVHEAFRDPDKSFSEAYAAAANVFGGWRFALDDSLVPDLHWRVRETVSNARLKQVREPDRAAVALSSGCARPSSPDRPAGVPVDAGCVAAIEQPQLTLWMGADKAVWLSAQGAAARRISTDVTSAYSIAALSPDFLVVGTVGTISAHRTRDLGQVWSFGTEAISRVRFSADGQFLFVLSQPARIGAGLTLTVLNARSGERLQEETVAATVPASAGLPHWCDNGQPQLAVAARYIVVCAGAVQAAYEIARGADDEILDKSSASGAILGADVGDSDVITYWNSNNVVRICAAVTDCSVRFAINGLNGPTREAMGLDRVSAILRATARQSGAAVSLAIETSSGSWTCTSPANWDCRPAGASSTNYDRRAPGCRGGRVLAGGTGEALVIDDAGKLHRCAKGGDDLIQFDSTESATTTAAAFARRASRFAVGRSSTLGSVIAIADEEGWIWPVRRWHALRASGPVAALRFSDDGDEIVAIEQSREALVVRHYPLAASAIVRRLRALTP